MKFYTKPELEISLFSTEDIITVSNTTSDDDTETETAKLLDDFNNGALAEDAAADSALDELF